MFDTSPVAAKLFHARFARAEVPGLRVVHQVGVQRIVAGDQNHQRPLPAAPGTPGLLPEGRDGAGETVRKLVRGIL